MTVEVIRDALTSGAVKIACGITSGTPPAPFILDTDFSGGSTVTRANSINLSAVYNPAPTAVYQSQRFGNFTYTVGGFSASAWNQIRLHFADTHWTTAGQRKFNVTINGKAALTNFDIIATVGAGNKALIESFTMQANSSGQYVIQFTTVVDAATVSGIEVGPTSQSGTPTTQKGTAYATQCAQQMVPLPPAFGGGGTCASCFAGTTSCINCTAGSWSYAGQLNSAENPDPFNDPAKNQSFNGPDQVDMFYWQAPSTTPGMCMMAARHSGDFSVDFHGVICQSATTGAVCYWDEAPPGGAMLWSFAGGGPNEQGHVVIPNPATVIASTTTNPTAFVGGADLVFSNASSPPHEYQNECSDCHAGRNTFNNHPGTATDVFGRGLVTAANYFPMSWPAPIVPAWDPGAAALGKPWARNPGPQATVSGSSCFACHTESAWSSAFTSGGSFAAPSMLTPLYCQTLLHQATHRTNNDCPNTIPWTPNGSPAPDIHCPVGAMPPSSASGPNSDGDAFALAALTHQTGLCFSEFRTQLLAPPGGGTVVNGAWTLSTSANFTSPTNPVPPNTQALSAGVSSAGRVVIYDPTGMRWVTATSTGMPGTTKQVSVGTDHSIWTLQQSGTTNYICAASAYPGSSCANAGTCTWTCDSSGYSGYSQLVAGSGHTIWALDAGKHDVWEFGSTGGGQYTPDSFFAAGEFTDTVAQLSVGLDEEMWVLSTAGTLYREVSSGNWSVIPSPAGGTVVSLAVANANDVWVASSSGLFRFVSPSSWEQHCPTSACSTGFTTVSAGGESIPNDPDQDVQGGIAEVWGLDASGNAYRVDRTKGSTTASMSKIPGATLTHISAGGMGDVMGINSAGTVFTFQ